MDERERVARLCESVGWDVTASAVRLNDRAALVAGMNLARLARRGGGYSASQFAVIDAVESLLAQEPDAQ